MHICLFCFTALVKSQCSWIRSTGMNHTLHILFPIVHMHNTSVSITASHYSVSLLLFPSSFPSSLVHSNHAAPPCPQFGMKSNSEDLQCWKKQNKKKNIIFAFATVCDWVTTRWVIHARGSILSCPEVIYLSSFSLKEIPPSNP